jgi:type IV pilus biogenesis protein CpaD/CtpE
MNAKIVIVSLGLVALAGCASVEPKACTAEWVDYKTEKVLKTFAYNNRDMINDLRRLQGKDGDIDPFVAIQLASKTKQIQKFADTFQTIVVPELEMAVDQCGNEKLVPAFTEFLRGEGVGEETLEWVAPLIGLMQDMREAENMSPRRL